MIKDTFWKAATPPTAGKYVPPTKAKAPDQPEAKLLAAVLLARRGRLMDTARDVSTAIAMIDAALAYARIT